MGLDLVEFVFAVECAFGLYLPEAEAAELATPGMLVDYLVNRLQPAESSRCLEQVAFHRLRRGVMVAFNTPRSAIRPDTPWESLLPARNHRHSWKVLGQAVGASDWPKFSSWWPFQGATETVGHTARHLATWCPASLKWPSQGWTRPEISHVITRLMKEQLGVTEFKMTDDFVRDLKLD